MNSNTFMLSSAAVRLLGFNASAIWFDEWIMRTRALAPWSAEVLDHDYTGGNPWDLLMRLVAWGPLWLFRLPALICSLAALWLAWKITEELKFDPRQRTAAAIGMAFMPGLIWMSQDARFYAAMILLFIAAVWFALRGGWLGLAACAGLLLYVHPTGPAFAAGAFVLALSRRTLSLKYLIIAFAITAIAWAPRLFQMLTFAPVRGELFSPLDLPHAYYAIVTAFFVDTISPNSLGGFMVFAVLVVTSLLMLTRLRAPQVQAAAIMFYVPCAALLLVSVFYQNVFIYRTVGVLGIPLALLIGTVVIPQYEVFWLEWYVGIFGGLLLLIGFVQYDPSTRGGDLDQVAAHVRSEWQTGDTIVYVNEFIGGPADYYLHDLSHCTVTSPHIFADCDLSAKRVWLFWPRDPSLDPKLDHMLRELTREAVPHFTVSKSWQISPVELYLLTENQ